MAREEEMWDDSALINAFNHALSNYKIMHNQGGKGSVSSSEEGKNISSRLETLPTRNDRILESRCLEKDSNENAASDTIEEIGETSNFTPIKENHHLESVDPEKDTRCLDGQKFQDEQKEVLNSQSIEDYNQLLSKYYEIEEQRQKVLQQLNQIGYWGDHNAYATTASQNHQAYATQASYSTMTCSCCPYGCQISVAPCTSLPVSGPGAVWVDGTVNTTCNPEGKEKELETKIDHIPQSSCTETDLNEVINSWYKAGFYTGKYLAEQKRQG